MVTSFTRGHRVRPMKQGTEPWTGRAGSVFPKRVASVPLEGAGDSRSSKNVKVSGSESHRGSLPLGEALPVLTGSVCPEHLPTSSLLHPVMWREQAPCLDPPLTSVWL